MERQLQGHINSCLLREHYDLECFRLVEEEKEGDYRIPSLEDTMPFLEMLQSVESNPPFLPLKEPNFQTLLKLQYLKKPWETSWDNNISSYNNNNNMTETHDYEHHVQAVSLLDQLESCVTHDNNIVDLQISSISPLKSETKDLETKHGSYKETQQFSKSCPVRERKKRKRTRIVKNKEEVESQRMTHIAVERNRRRQMNDHLISLRSLMPPSYVLRGDQASIVGGAINFVKELEQLLHSLEEQKRMRTEAATATATTIGRTSRDIFKEDIESFEEEAKIKTRRYDQVEEIIEVSQVSTIQNHVNLNIHCQRRPGQLLRAIVAVEDLKLTILHLNITSSQATVLYSFNLKIEEDCELRSGDEVVAAVHQIFSKINGS